MANYATLKAAIQQVVKTNGNNEITGALLQQSLLTMVNSFGANYQFVGVAQPSTNPGTPDQNVFYIAGAGTYVNFGNTTVPVGQLGLFKYNGSWTFETVQVGTDNKGIEAFTQFGLPMIKKGTELDDVVGQQGQYSTFTPSVFSQFFLDMKLVGTPEPNTKYRFANFQHRVNSGGPYYANYLVIRKSTNNWSSSTQVAAILCGSVPPSGIQLYEITPTNSTLTQIRLLINWDAISSYDTNITGSDYGRYNIPLSYDMDMSYMTNQEYGIIPIIDAYRATREIPTINGILPFVQFGLPGIKRGTNMPSVIHSVIGDDITAVDFSRFVLDMKIVGTPEESAQYRLRYFQHRANSGGPGYSNYLTFAKSTNNWSSYTDVGSKQIGAVPPSGIQLYEITPTNSTLTKIRILLNWDALKEYNNLTGSNYARYNVPVAYQFDMNYMMNQEYGVIPAIDSFRGVSNVPQLVEDVATPIVNNALNYGLEIQLPNVLYAVVGTEMNLWNDTIAYSVDRGLQSPLNYSIQWDCSVGLVTSRCFRFTPQENHAGNNYNLTCRIYGATGGLVATKTVQIRVKAKNALSQSKRIVYFGDSLGASSAIQLYNDFQNSDKFAGVAPVMLGTKGTTPHYEAVGGYRWVDYATQGRRAFRCYVSNFTDPIGINTKYTNNGFQWTVIEVNVTGGNGNILITKEDIGGTDAPLTNGSLVSVGSYATIPYTNATLEGANPLWNASTQQIDVANYRQLLGLGTNEKIDAVSFQFGINDNQLANDLPTLLSYIQTLYNAFIADNPNCLFLIGLTTTAGNDANGAGANYGASFSYIDYNHRVFLIRQFYLTLQNNAQMPNIRIAPIHPQVDRYFGYPFGSREISQRYTEMEQYHTNYVHPSVSGYGQIGDAYFAAYIGALTE